MQKRISRVLKVDAEGRYTCLMADGSTAGGLNTPLFDDTGQQITPTVTPAPLTETDILKAQVQALTERGEFLEDVIAELAMMVL